MRHSIFRKLLSGYIALTLFIVSMTAVVSFFFVSHYTIRSNQNSLRYNAEVVAKMLKEPYSRVWLMAPGQRNEILTLADASLAIVYPDMSVRNFESAAWHDDTMVNDDTTLFDVRQSLDAHLLGRLLEGELITDIRNFDFIEDEVVFAGAPVLGANGTVECAVLLYRSIRRIEDSVYSIVVMLLIAGTSALVVAIVLAYFIGRMVSNPLVEMSRAATLIAEGNYGAQVAIRSSDEVGQLGTMLNVMSTKLSDVIQNLDDEKNKLEQIMASIGDGIVAIDRDGCVVHRNRIAHELLSIGTWEGPAAERRIQLVNLLIESMNSLQNRELTFDIAGRTIAAICSPILQADGTAYGAVCLMHDVSELQRLEQMRRDYIANISHELRTPLTGIRGMVEPLMDGYMETEEERQDCYHIIYQETLRLERLIGEMLDLSRLQEGRIQLELEPMDAFALIGAAIRRTQAKAREAGVELLADGQRDLFVMGNEDRIIQVLIALLDNALSFTQPGGSVTLSVKDAANGYVAMSVKDTGAGIAAEDLPFIWERFFKADRPRLRTRGVGLGLPIAKLIVELMGGRIYVKSTLGEGAEFTFTLKKARGNFGR